MILLLRLKQQREASQRDLVLYLPDDILIIDVLANAAWRLKYEFSTGNGGPSTLGLPRSGFNERGYEYWNNISALKAGLVYADKLSTVSPTYASELMTESFGMGLDGVRVGRREAQSPERLRAAHRRQVRLAQRRRQRLLQAARSTAASPSRCTPSRSTPTRAATSAA